MEEVATWVIIGIVITHTLWQGTLKKKGRKPEL